MREPYRSKHSWEVRCSYCTSGRGLMPSGRVCEHCGGSGCVLKDIDELLKILKRQEARLAKKRGDSAERRLKSEVGRLEEANKYVVGMLKSERDTTKAFYEMRALLQEILDKDEKSIAELQGLGVIPDTRLVAKARALLAKYPV